MKKKILRFAALAVAAIVTIIVLFYVWTDWIGARRWKAVESALKARGEPLSIAEITPPPVPDELNLAAAPIFAELATIPDSAQWRLSKIKGLVGGGKPDGSPLANAARSVDPNFAGTEADAARRILEETEKWRPILDEVRAATKRPGTAWPVNFHDGFRMKLNHISPLLKLGQALSTEAKAQLELGDPNAALVNFRLVLDLSERAASPPTVINYLVRQSLVGLDLSVLRYGLDRHRWTEAQLDAIQPLLAGISLPRGLQQGLRGERVLFNQTVVAMDRDGLRALFAAANPQAGLNRWEPLIWSLRPEGWRLDERRVYTETLQKWTDQIDAPPGQARTTDSLPSFDWLSSIRLTLVRIALEGIAPSYKRTLQGQTQVDLARVACALERYRLKNHSLPPTLDALVPAFLPKIPADRLSGGRLQYRLQGPDRAQLYSVGWNQTDDGGNGVDPTHPQRRESLDAPDLIWAVE